MPRQNMNTRGNVCIHMHSAGGAAEAGEETAGQGRASREWRRRGEGGGGSSSSSSRAATRAGWLSPTRWDLDAVSCLSCVSAAPYRLLFHVVACL